MTTPAVSGNGAKAADGPKRPRLVRSIAQFDHFLIKSTHETVLQVVLGSGWGAISLCQQIDKKKYEVVWKPNDFVG